MINPINERFNQWRIHNRYSQKEIAIWLGLTKATVSHIVTGKVGLSTKHIKTLSEQVPELNCRWMLTGQGSMHYEEARGAMERDKYERIITELERIIVAKDEIISLLKSK
jgi:predicted transcriptional regulator